MATSPLARLNVGRLNALRLGNCAPVLRMTMAGTRIEDKIHPESLVVRDLLNGTPNTASFRARSTLTPVLGAEVLIGLGDLNRYGSPLIFGGHILRISQVSLGPSLVAYDVDCISYEWILGRRMVTARYQNMSASAIAKALIAAYAPLLASTGVEPNLPSLTEFSLTFEDLSTALDRLASRAGAAWVVGPDKVLYFAVDPKPMPGPVGDIVDGNVHGAQPSLSVSRDFSQVKTRILVEGGGGTVLGDVLAGDTIIPVDDLSWYQDVGGELALATQRVTYTGRLASEGGALVGTFAAPTTAPTTALAGGAGITAGPHYYAVTFTDATPGETLPGPNSTTRTNASSLSAPTSNPTPERWSTAGSLAVFTAYTYSYTYLDSAGGETTECVLPWHSTETKTSIRVQFATGPDGTAKRRIYRSPDADYLGQRKLVTTINNNTEEYFVDTLAEASLGANAPTSNTTNLGQVSLSNIPIGPSGTTNRKLYRTAAGGSQLKLVTTIAGNGTTTYTDTMADGSLGANVPVTNTSTLVSATGTILAGSTTIPVTGTSAFAAGGGWAQSGGLFIRYASISGQSLAGIPASGIGAVLATINYGNQIVSCPVLTGVAGAGNNIETGTPANVLATASNADAITAMIAAVGGDGIFELHIADNRLSLVEATARAEAKLLEVKDEIVSVAYDTYDLTTRSGLTVTIDRTTEAIDGTYRIQSVTLSGFSGHPTDPMRPLRRVEASSRRFSFEALLQLIKGR